MNPHELCLGQAQDYFSGRLDAQRRLAWEAHRAACPACSGVLEQWPQDAPVPDLEASVRRALARQGLMGSARPPRALVPWLLPLATALALALLITAFWRPQRQWVQDDTHYGDTCTIHLKGGQPCCAD